MSMIAVFSGCSDAQFLMSRTSAARLFAFSSKCDRRFASLKNDTRVPGERGAQAAEKALWATPRYAYGPFNQEHHHVRFNVPRDDSGFHPRPRRARFPAR